MSKTIKISIVDKDTIRLEEDAEKGDIIKLTDVLVVDTTNINKAIDDKKDRICCERIEKEKENILALLKLKLESQYTDKYSKELKTLKIDNEKLKLELKNSNNNKDLCISEAVSKKENELNKEINNLKSNNANLNNEYESFKKNIDLQRQLEISNLKQQLHQEFTKKYEELKKENMDLSAKLNHSAIGTKRLGQDFEDWCDRRVKEAFLYSFDTCKWNKLTKGDSRADFELIVYENSQACLEDDQNKIICKVCCEMKTESSKDFPTNKKRNKDHYKKLAEDSQDYDYAVLISELELNTDDYVPIEKVKEYRNMFMVRPWFFISLLGIIVISEMKKVEIKSKLRQQKIEFEQQEKILSDFENLKNEILENSAHNIETKTRNIIDQANNIQKSVEKILQEANLIINKHLITVKNKINNFNIEKIVKKISKL